MILVILLSVVLRVYAAVVAAWMFRANRDRRVAFCVLLLILLAGYELGMFYHYGAVDHVHGVPIWDYWIIFIGVIISIVSVVAVHALSHVLFQASAQSETDFQQYSSEVPIPLAVTRVKDGQVLYINAEAQRHYTHHAGENPKHDALQFYQEVVDRQLLQDPSNIDDPDKYHELLLRFPEQTHTTRWVAASIRKMTFGDELVYISSFQDITDNKATETLLRESVGIFREIYEKSPDAIFVESLKGEVLDVNPAACKLHGLPREELIGKHVTDLVPENQRRAVQREFAKVVSGELTSFSGKSIHVNGFEVPVEIRTREITYRNEKALILNVRDTVERQRIEQRFRESERMLARAQEIATLGSASRDLVEETFSASTQFYRIFGFDPETDRVTTLDQIIQRIHPDDRDRVQQHMTKTIETGTATPIEYRVQRPDGVIRDVLSQSEIVYDTDDKPLRTIDTVQDVTTLKRAERAALANEARLRLILEQVPAVLWTTDKLLRFTSSAGAGLQMLNLQPNETVGQTLYEFFSTDDADHTSIAMHLRALKGESCRYEEEIEELTFQTYLEPLRDAKGTIVGVIGIALDITNRKQAELRQTVMLQELDHRVKNNLASVISIAEQSLNRCETLEEFREIFTGRIMAMARTHSVLAKTHWEGAELYELIEMIVAAYNFEGNQRVKFEGPRLVLPTKAALPICMAIHELATNAVKYGALSNATGHVQIKWAQPKPRFLELIWEEIGGPPVVKPTERGFGTQFIERGIGYQLGGDVVLSFAPEGLVCEMRVNLRDRQYSRGIPKPQASQDA